MAERHYSKSFVPLESDPDIFTALSHDLGIGPKLAFKDVLSINDSIPYSTLAVILILPASEVYEERRNQLKGFSSSKAEVIWFEQTINNACGLYAILHVACSELVRPFILPGSILAELIECKHDKRTAFLDNSKDLQSKYEKAALQGSTRPPDPEEEVDHHYICFVKSEKGAVYELDGDLSGPVNTGIILRDDEDLSIKGLQLVRETIERDKDASLNFSVLALSWK